MVVETVGRMLSAELRTASWIVLAAAAAATWLPGLLVEPQVDADHVGTSRFFAKDAVLHPPWPTVTGTAGIVTALTSAMLSLSGLVGVLSRHAARQGQVHADYVSAGWTALIVFGAMVLSVRFLAGVPGWLAAIAASPCLVIPLVLERLRHPFENRSETSEKGPPQPTYRFDQDIFILERALESDVVKTFMARYPKCRVYLYQEATWDGRGGLLLANRERMHMPSTIYLDVTLVCPFGAKPGLLLLGQERILSYFYRPATGGSHLCFLPRQRWEDWLEGMTEVDWFVKLREVHHVPKSDFELGDLPYQLVDGDWRWKPITLRVEPHPVETAQHAS